jgi:hypothetical protein
MTLPVTLSFRRSVTSVTVATPRILFTCVLLVTL